MSFQFESVHWQSQTINENRPTSKHITVKFQDTRVKEHTFEVYSDKKK